MSKKYRFLIADDNKANLKVAEFILKPLATSIDLAVNGQEAFEKFIVSRYDVILMDVHMPVLDGYEATREIRRREQENGAAKPVIIIATTASNQPEEVAKSQSAGMNDVVVKPFTLAEIISVIS